jgi:hypothetical protein
MTILADKRLFFAAVLSLGLLAMTARTATDPDLWWHLRTGQWIVETGHVPHTDPFSFTRGGSPWVSHEWLSEVIFYALWRLAGPTALIVFSSLITTAGFLLLYWRCLGSPASPGPPERPGLPLWGGSPVLAFSGEWSGEPHWAAAATVLGAMASAPCWGSRPQMFTLLLASLFLWLLDRAEQRPRLLLWIPPLFLLWLNLHAGFALGPALLLLYAGGLFLEALAGTIPWPEARPILTRVLLATLACLALVPLNPAGARLYRYPFETVRASELRSLIVEWLSPDFHRSMYFPFLLVLLLLLVALAWSRFPVHGRALVPLMFMLLSALDAVRHIPIFMLVAMPVIAQALPRSAQPAWPSAHRPPRQRFRTLSYSAALVFLAVFALWRWTTLANTQNAHAAALFPRNAVAFLRAGQFPERLFAYYDWGGYVIWNLYPQYRPFADGRSDLYSGDLLKQAAQTVPNLRQGWQAILDGWHVETVLIPPDTALAQALLLDQRWTVPYHDSQAIIFVRNHPNQQALLPALSSKRP